MNFNKYSRIQLKEKRTKKKLFREKKKKKKMKRTIARKKEKERTNEGKSSYRTHVVEVASWLTLAYDKPSAMV